MIRYIKNLHRTLKRLKHFQAGSARLQELRPAIERILEGPVHFHNGKGGGHDFVYFVHRDDLPVAVLRIANQLFTPESTPQIARLNGPRLRLTPKERIAREWRVCQSGWTHGLTPKPIWRSSRGDALLNSFVTGHRLADFVQMGSIDVWDAIDRVAERVTTFHALLREAHMDLSLFNAYGDDPTGPLTLIDFELAPNPALSTQEAFLFDYLNLVEMAYKDMSESHKQAGPDRLAALLDRLPDEVRSAPLDRLAHKLPRILADPALWRDLRPTPEPHLVSPL